MYQLIRSDKETKKCEDGADMYGIFDIPYEVKQGMIRGTRNYE